MKQIRLQVIRSAAACPQCRCTCSLGQSAEQKPIHRIRTEQPQQKDKGEKMRLFLTEAGYGKALENQENPASKSQGMKQLMAK